MKNHPGTSGLMPVKGSACGLRPDLDEFTVDTGFDFSQARELQIKNKDLQKNTDNIRDPEPKSQKTSGNTTP